MASLLKIVASATASRTPGKGRLFRALRREDLA
jgi:hypothetical protein